MRKLLLLLALLLPWKAFGATASPVAISGVTVSGTTLTVTTAAPHGLSATLPSGFCISGSSVTVDNVCGVVLTAPTGTTLTFILSGGAVCSASCGTLLPMKRVVWLVTATVPGGFQVSYLLWLATTNTPIAGKTSVWLGASTAENNALVLGSFIEVQRAQFFPLGTTLANAEAQFVNDWTAQQNQLTGSVQPGAFFGNFFDGTGWVQ